MTAKRAEARYYPKPYVPEPDPPPPYRLARFVRKQVGGPDSPVEDREAERLSAKTDRKPEYGAFVPFGAIGRRDLTVGVPAGGGDLVGGADARPDLFIPFLRGASIVPALGIEEIPNLTGNTMVPRFGAGVVGGWSAEGVAPTESTPTTEQVLLTPKKLAAYVDYSRNLLLQAALLEDILRADLRGAFGFALDAGLLNGGGGTAPTGILGTSGIGSVTGTSLNIGGVTDTVAAVAAAKVPLDGGAWAMPSAMWKLLASRVATGSGRLLIEDGKMAGYPVHVTEAMPASTILFGNFALGVAVATWGPGIDVLVNPYSGAKSGLVSIVGHVLADVLVRRPGAFCKIVSVT
ncbi:MAG: hypothetical protein Kow00128_19180 [Deltaproteobacteria bacterium]